MEPDSVLFSACMNMICHIFCNNYNNSSNNNNKYFHCFTYLNNFEHSNEHLWCDSNMILLTLSNKFVRIMQIWIWTKKSLKFALERERERRANCPSISLTLWKKTMNFKYWTLNLFLSFKLKYTTKCCLFKMVTQVASN